MAALVDEAEESDEDTPDPPEPIVNGIIDLGRLATDALFLGDRSLSAQAGCGVRAVVEAADPEDHPFAALKALKAEAKKPTGRSPKASEPGQCDEVKYRSVGLHGTSRGCGVSIRNAI